MKLASLFAPGKTVFSCEVFPPKKTSTIRSIYETLYELRDLKPDFISVTFGAGGSLADLSTVDVAAMIKQDYGIESAAHLTCVRNDKEDVDRITEELQAKGVDNILALRGDINPDVPPKTDFTYASDLAAYLREKGDFGISGGCYPEGHLESASLEQDVANLKKKVDAGVTHLISQLFFDNSKFYHFLQMAREAGITVPIEAGIMPVTNKKQIYHMVHLCGASLPEQFSHMMEFYDPYPDALREAGIAYAIAQIVDLVAHGVDGIHLYTMNNSYVAKRIARSVLPVIRRQG